MYDSRESGKKGKRRDQGGGKRGYSNNGNSDAMRSGFGEWNAPGQGLWQQFGFGEFQHHAQSIPQSYDRQYQRGGYYQNNSNANGNDFRQQNNGHYGNGHNHNQNHNHNNGGGSRNNKYRQQKRPSDPKEARPPPKQQPTEEEPNLPDTVTQTPPCKHNEWMCSDRRKYFVTLKCIACNQKWKTQLKKFNKCPDFHADERFCPKGNDCPHPHVYARSRLKEAPSRKKQAEEQARLEKENKLRVIQTMPQMGTEGEQNIPEAPHKAKTLPPQQWQTSATTSGLYIPENVPSAVDDNSFENDNDTAPDVKAATLPTSTEVKEGGRRPIRHIPTAPTAQTGEGLGKSVELNSRSSTTPHCFVESSRLSASADSNSLNRCGTAPASKLREEEQGGISKSATLPHGAMTPLVEEEPQLPGIQLNSTKLINDTQGTGRSNEARKNLASFGDALLSVDEMQASVSVTSLSGVSCRDD